MGGERLGCQHVHILGLQSGTAKYIACSCYLRTVGNQVVARTVWVFFLGEVIPSDTDPWHTSRKP